MVGLTKPEPDFPMVKILNSDFYSFEGTVDEKNLIIVDYSYVNLNRI